MSINKRTLEYKNKLDAFIKQRNVPLRTTNGVHYYGEIGTLKVDVWPTTQRMNMKGRHVNASIKGIDNIITKLEQLL